VRGAGTTIANPTGWHARCRGSAPAYVTRAGRGSRRAPSRPARGGPRRAGCDRAEGRPLPWIRVFPRPFPASIACSLNSAAAQRFPGCDRCAECAPKAGRGPRGPGAAAGTLPGLRRPLACAGRRRTVTTPHIRLAPRTAAMCPGPHRPPSEGQKRDHSEKQEGPGRNDRGLLF
jgi:hypothetical protein